MPVAASNQHASPTVLQFSANDMQDGLSLRRYLATLKRSPSSSSLSPSSFSPLTPSHHGLPASMKPAPTGTWFTEKQRLSARALAATSSAITLLCALITFYWFLRMKKRFRHMLIMWLVLGDIIRALSYFVFAVDSLASGQFATDTNICQLSGWLAQVGTQITDFTALFIAIHSSMQILRPPMSPYGKDGLRRFRYWVYSCTFFVPLTTASFAYITSSHGYLAQGVICSLPVRPFWYRLALAWIPRYIIGSIILALAIVLYLHVGWQLGDIKKHGRRAFSIAVDSGPQPSANSSKPQSQGRPEVQLDAAPADTSRSEDLASHKYPNFEGDQATPGPKLTIPASFRTDEVMSDNDDLVMRHRRRPSAVTFTTVEYTSGGTSFKQDIDEMEGGSWSALQVPPPTAALQRESGSRRGSFANFTFGPSTTAPSAVSTPIQEHAPRLSEPLTPISLMRPMPPTQPSASSAQSGAMTPITSTPQPGRLRRLFRRNSDAYSCGESDYENYGVSHSNPWATRFGVRRQSTNGDDTLQQRERRRMHIIRQMRLLFIYPTVYLVMWLVPFILHCMQYNNHYAANPPYPLAVMSLLCITGMGAIDCVIFTLHEKPWRYRTVRRCGTRDSVKSSLRGSILLRHSQDHERSKRNSHELAARPNSKFADITPMKEQALERLAAERFDRTKKGESVVEGDGGLPKMWWDKNNNDNLQKSPSHDEDIDPGSPPIPPV